MGFHHGMCLQSLYNKFGGVTESKVISGIYLESRVQLYTIQRTFFTTWESISLHSLYAILYCEWLGSFLNEVELGSRVERQSFNLTKAQTRATPLFAHAGLHD